MTPPERDDQRPDPAAMQERMRRWRPPINELPVPIELPAVVFRGDRFAIGLRGVAYSTGLSLSLAVREASRRPEDPRLFQRTGGDASMPADEQFLVGIELADGRKALLTGPSGPMTDPRSPDEPESLLLVHSMSHPQGDLGMDMTLWLTPVPPPGPTTLVVRCIALGLAETTVHWDGAPIAEAAAGIVPLWPMPEPPSRPRPPQRPTDGWFAAPTSLPPARVEGSG